MITKDNLLKLFKKEFETTLKVMRAYPEDKLDYAPHERSQTAKKIMSTFVFEMYLIKSYVLGEKFDSSLFQNYLPGDLKTLIKDFEKESTEIISAIGDISDSGMKGTIEFAGVKYAADEFMLMMLMDQVHHRGQMTVYIRLAGGKVPSVYGPSADDPSTNL